MKAIRSWVSALTLLAATALPAQVVAIKAGRLVDPASGTTSVDQVILVEAGKITAVGASIPIPANAKVVDLSKKTVLPGLFDAWYDANNGERGGDMMLRGVVAAARARAEDFYFPASVLHAMGPPDLEGTGADMVEMRRTLVGVPQTLRRGDRPGRNDACHCGSGKKFKKCHGR